MLYNFFLPSFGRYFILLFLSFFLVGHSFCQNEIKAEPEKIDGPYGKGSTQQKTTYTDPNGVSWVKIEIRDPNGKLREEKLYGTSKRPDGLGGTEIVLDNWLRKFDCTERLIYVKNVVTRGGKERWYNDANYEYSKGYMKQTSGMGREVGPDGSIHKYRFNPTTSSNEEISQLPLNEQESYVSLEPAATICALPGKKNEIFIGPSFHRESYKGNGENFFGANICYSHMLNNRFDLVGDFAGYFKKSGSTNLNKFFAMAGTKFYPFKKATSVHKLSFSLDAEAGVSVVAKRTNSTKSSKSGLIISAGHSLDFDVSENTRIEIRGNYGRRIVIDDVGLQIRESIGIVKRIGK